jgi:hypothetical protein
LGPLLDNFQELPPDKILDSLPGVNRDSDENDVILSDKDYPHLALQVAFNLAKILSKTVAPQDYGRLYDNLNLWDPSWVPKIIDTKTYTLGIALQNLIGSILKDESILTPYYAWRDKLKKMLTDMSAGLTNRFETFRLHQPQEIKKVRKYLQLRRDWATGHTTLQHLTTSVELQQLLQQTTDLIAKASPIENIGSENLDHLSSRLQKHINLIEAQVTRYTFPSKLTISPYIEAIDKGCSRQKLEKIEHESMNPSIGNTDSLYPLKIFDPRDSLVNYESLIENAKNLLCVLKKNVFTISHLNQQLLAAVNQKIQEGRSFQQDAAIDLESRADARRAELVSDREKLSNLKSSTNDLNSMRISFNRDEVLHLLLKEENNQYAFDLINNLDAHLKSLNERRGIKYRIDLYLSDSDNYEDICSEIERLIDCRIKLIDEELSIDYTSTNDVVVYSGEYPANSLYAMQFQSLQLSQLHEMNYPFIVGLRYFNEQFANLMQALNAVEAQKNSINKQIEQLLNADFFSENFPHASDNSQDPSDISKEEQLRTIDMYNQEVINILSALDKLWEDSSTSFFPIYELILFQAREKYQILSEKIRTSTGILEVKEMHNRLAIIKSVKACYEAQARPKIEKINEALALSKRYFGGSSKKEGIFYLYLEERHRTYFYSDCFSNFIAIGLGCFGYKTENCIRTKYIIELAMKLDNYLANPDEDSQNSLNQLVSKGIKQFKPRSTSSQGYKKSLRFHIECFKHDLESCYSIYQKIPAASTTLTLSA